MSRSQLDNEDLRLAVYRAFVADGRAPGVDRLAGELGVDDGAVRAGLRELHDTRHVVLDAGGDIVMAHPFSAVPLGFAVMGRRTLWWGGCAWDAFALPHLLPAESPVLVSTRCPACERAHAWNVDRDTPPPGSQVAHFGVPVPRIWDDVVHTCAHQRIFCSAGCVEHWLASTGSSRGYLLDLPTLWRLAAHWYDGRLERGYVRREPVAAADYFRSVGLAGPFWGLEST